jgi:choline/glycine/proline betaine transport protein
MLVLFKYGHVHLGRKADKPEFSTPAYVSMIFIASVGNSLLVYSVQEPLTHRMHHFFARAGYRSQDEIDMFAINMTVTNWGVGCWSAYAIVAVALSLAMYRFNLPPTFRSCFYPVLGHYTWGWIGDVIDGLAVLLTLSAICISLGFLSVSLSTDSTSDRSSVMQTTVVWVITVLSLASVTSGLKRGMKCLCIFSMALVCILMLIVLTIDDTKFVLNLQVQQVGYYLQHSLFQLNFFTDAFGQLREGSGRAIDGKASEQWWMSVWLNFCQCWW